MVLSLNFNHLYYFYLVGKSGGLTEAARLLRISQPSLSAQMKVLEKRLGVPLFRKAGRRLELTAEGHRVFSSCEKMFSVAENLERDLDSETRSHQIQVRIGVSSDIERPFAVDILSRAFAREPRVKVRFLSGGEDVLRREISVGNYDFVLTTSPLFSDEVRLIAESELPVVAGVSKKLLKGSGKPRRIRDLPNKWVAPAPHQKLRKEADTYFEKIRVSPLVTFESDVMGALIRAIADGLGWGLLPKAYLKHESMARNIEILGPRHGFWTHRIYLLAAKNSSHADKFARSFATALKTEIDS